MLTPTPTPKPTPTQTPTITPTPNNTPTNSTSNSNNLDNTTKNGDIAFTGVEDYILPGIIIILIIGTVALFKIKQYKDI